MMLRPLPPGGGVPGGGRELQHGHHRLLPELPGREQVRVLGGGSAGFKWVPTHRNGFYLEDEMSPDWEDLDQTQILFYHSWINEYVR